MYPLSAKRNNFHIIIHQQVTSVFAPIADLRRPRVHLDFGWADLYTQL